MQEACAHWVSSNRCLLEYFDDDDADLLEIFKDGIDSLLSADAKYAKRSPYPATKEATQEAMDYLYQKISSAFDDEHGAGHYSKQEHEALQIRLKWLYKQSSFLYGDRDTEPTHWESKTEFRGQEENAEESSAEEASYEEDDDNEGESITKEVPPQVPTQAK